MATATIIPPLTTKTAARTRDAYGALLPAHVPPAIRALVERVADEAGWDLGAGSSGTYGRRSYTFEARNTSVYGYALYPQMLAVVQIRRYFQNKYGASVRKSYALIGLDEGDQLFSHVLPSSPRHWSGIDTMTPEEVVTAAESKIFGVPVARLDQIVRQGDIAIVPVRAIPGSAERIEEDRAIHEWKFANSHSVIVDGDIWDHPDGLYADGLVEIIHDRGQHHPISYEGRCRIVIGREGDNPWWIDTALGD